MRVWPVLCVGLGILFGVGTARAGSLDWGTAGTSDSSSFSCQGEWARRLGPVLGSQCVLPPGPRLPGFDSFQPAAWALEPAAGVAFPMRRPRNGSQAGLGGVGLGGSARTPSMLGLRLPLIATAHAVRHIGSGLSLWASGRHALLPEVSGERPHEATAAIGLVQRLGRATAASFRFAMTRLDGGRHAGGVDFFGVAEVELRQQLSNRFQVGVRYGHWQNEGRIGLGDFTHDRVQFEVGFRL